MNVAKIPLSGKRGLGKFALVDAEDVIKVASIKWHLSDMGYAVNRRDGKTLRMHRLIANTPEELIVDHLNNNTLDNRKSNLRNTDHKANANNKSGVKGYTWDAAKNKFLVRYKKKFYGRYATEEEAKKVFQLAKSGMMYYPSKRKLYNLPRGITKQFGKYRVRPRVNGVRYWLGEFKDLEEAKIVLKQWQER